MTDQQKGATLAPVKFNYLDFLWAIQQARHTTSSVLWLPPDEQRLLEIIAVQHAAKRPLSMMQALELRNELFLSPSAVSRKIENLRQAELIHVVADTVDRRMKYLEPTEKALAHFDYLGTLMSTSVVA